MVGNLKLSTSSQCIKYLMFVFNLLFVITGIILLSIGSVIHSVYYNYHHFLDDRFFSVPSLLIAVGSIIFFIAFFGCCGAVRENYCMIVTFATLMVLVFILELSAGISGYVLRNTASENIQEKMLETMKNYNKSVDITEVWNKLQKDFECCGTNNPTEWTRLLGNDTLPTSCCPTQNLKDLGTISTCHINSTNVYKVGCLPALESFVKAHAVQLGGAGLGIAFVQATGIWFSVFLAKSIKRSYENIHSLDSQK
ncbi:PREDICTED: CD63 antigen [Ceratosolen solmsi marchali]|uniref:Tetraspanin n=1 Tax=Ceratosolen solmsi marchali TaxID=326594 RepID=A0AAJ6VNS7_9HYME|nr:PREDICTED: CD63 antigen [Ceratosolen solmsi marchali]